MVNKHDLADSIEHLIGAFHRIKGISTSGEIDRLCIDGISKLMALTDAARVQKELDEIRARRIDPTM